MKYVNHNGLTLIGLIGVMLVLSLLAVGILVVFATGMLSTVGTSDATAAFFAAETGVSVEKANLSTNFGVFADLPYTNAGTIGGATYSAVVNSTNPPIIFITSTGRKNDSQWTSISRGTGVVEALVVYRYSTSNRPQYRVSYQAWDNAILGGEQYAQSAGGAPQWQRIVASPLTNQFLLVTQNDLRWIYAQAYSNGVWFASTLLNGAGRAPIVSARGYDVAYENLSGRGMVVYSTNGVNPQYRIWNGTNWSGQTAITNIGATGAIRWVRLVPKPDSNEMMLLARWRKTTAPAGNYSSAIIWDGASSWVNPQSLESNCASEIAYETMDAAYMTNSAVAVYINGATAAARAIPKYRIYSATGWSGQSNMVTLGGAPRWIRVEPSRDGAGLAAVFLYVQSGARLKSSYWDGSAWDSYVDFQSAILETSTERDFDIAWSSQANTVMVTYCVKNTSTHSYMIRTVGGSTVYGNMASGTEDGTWSVLKSDPLSSEFVYVSLDSQSDVDVQRWDGGSWTDLSEVEDRSSLTYNSIDIAFRRDIPGP